MTSKQRDFMSETPDTEMKNRYPRFFKAVESSFSPISIDMVVRALVIAGERLADSKRYDGTPMLQHSINMAVIVVDEIGLGRNSVIASLLHDVARTGRISIIEIIQMFGDQVAGIVSGLSNISEVDTKVADEQIDNFRELIVSYSSDPRVILLKLADRLEVMRVLAMFPAEKRRKKSWESLNLYAQIAHKLGLYSVKSELEDLALKYLEPGDYNEIHGKLRETETERQKFIRRFIAPIEEKLNTMDIKYHIKSRTKSIYSIWRKMKRTGVQFEEVYDIFALRIIVDCPVEQEKMLCWNIFSVVTDFYTPNPERMRDWISIPKSNGYESLHTTVVTPEGKWVEIQIRSERMDAVAERGIAAHWRYKGVNQGDRGTERWLERLRELMESDSHQLATRLDVKPQGEVFAFTPKGDLRKLPEGATLLDFAFDIHSNLGATCTGGRINQRNATLKDVLRNGDIVEIFTSKNQKPKLAWLQFVTTSKAKNKIRAFLREEQAKAASLGREELERKIKNWKFNITIDDAVTALCRYYKLKTGTELYGKIADQTLDIASMKDIIAKYIDGELFEPKTRMTTGETKQQADKSTDALIIDDGVHGLEYKLAKCCNPIYGDEIFGFITINSGITIHRFDCPNAARMQERYPYRVIAAKWRNNDGVGAFRASMRVVADDVHGMVNTINDVIGRDLGLTIRSMNLTSNNGSLSGLINVEVKNVQTVDFIVHSLMRIKGMQKVYRVNN